MRSVLENGKGRQAALLLLASLVLPASGCLAVAAGVAGGAGVGYAYYMGELFDKFNADVPNTAIAARAAFQDLNMPLSKEEVHPASTVLESRTSDGDVVRVTMSPHQGADAAAPSSTQVGIRVGYFGDSKLCGLLFERMTAHLAPNPGRLAPSAQPPLGPIQPVAATGTAPESPPPPLATKS